MTDLTFSSSGPPGPDVRSRPTWPGDSYLIDIRVVISPAQPGFTIEQYRSLPFFRDLSKWADQVAEALRLAGMPER
ncbi:hypothetical protein [Sinorhizobium sp. BG8]|uniref:hypothetical protein n=1 Tax=Sinorhizobium sp. BG8 TaxID=2613773 RepID=UPI00193CCE9D|nr:hypothetical protein [Sinorhizobium sp. BG8]QRM55343.1 hypothetical protein F3Y30_12985 [Sinorhizobium sp. BG8]